MPRKQFPTSGTSRAKSDFMANRTSLHTSFTYHATLALLLGLGGTIAAGAGACGGTGEGSAGSGASASNGNGTGSSQGGGTFTGTGSNTGTMTGVGGGCAGTTQEAQLTPVTMYIMFDKSGSMNNVPSGGTQTKWDASTQALTQFVQDPDTAGLGVTIRFFPDGTCNDASCSINACEQPLVPAAPLTADPAPMDTQEQAIVNAIASETASGNTPTYPALGGAIQWAAGYMGMNPGEKAVVVFVTDGLPTVCDTNSANIVALAADGWATSGVYTYAIGLPGAGTTLMDQIAAAGNTSPAIIIQGANAAADLLAALKAIQGSQLSCNFQMPQSMNGEAIDPTQVNVTYTPGGGMPTTIDQVSGPVACGPGGGWYYDDPMNPTQISLCPVTCQTVQADPNGKIQIVVGCATQAAE